MITYHKDRLNWKPESFKFKCFRLISMLLISEQEQRARHPPRARLILCSCPALRTANGDDQNGNSHFKFSGVVMTTFLPENNGLQGVSQ